MEENGITTVSDVCTNMVNIASMELPTTTKIKKMTACYKNNPQVNGTFDCAQKEHFGDTAYIIFNGMIDGLLYTIIIHKTGL